MSTVEERLAAYEKSIERSGHPTTFIKRRCEIIHKDQDRQQVFGWASVIEKNGAEIVDFHQDVIDVDELENAAHDFILSSGEGRLMHTEKVVARPIASLVFTKELQKTLGIDLGLVGWLLGFQVEEQGVWKAIKEGRLSMFSIGGSAIREPIQ